MYRQTKRIPDRGHKKLSIEEAKLCARIASGYESDESVLLFFCPRSAKDPDSRVEMVSLVIPELLQQDFLHHYHTILEGGHQGIGRTYQRIRSNFHWRGLYRSVQPTWEIVCIARREKENLFFAANRRGTSKLLTRFK